MCRTADRPGEGGLFVIMKKTRNLYHYAVRRIKKKAQKLLEASDSGSSDLLNEMKKVKGSKKFWHDPPDEVAGASGEPNIVEKFYEVY